MLVTNPGLGAAVWVKVTSAMPLIVETTLARLLFVLGSREGVSIEVSVAVLVVMAGERVATTIVCLTVALLVRVPMLKVTSPPLVLELPKVVETERI